MAKRRANGEGSIHQRGSDGRWAASLSIGKGKRKHFLGRTRAEVAAKLVDAQKKLMEGLPVVDERQTTSQFLQDWLKASKDRLRPRTWTRYDELIRLYVTPEIGSTRIARLSPQQLNKVYTKAREKGRSSSTVHQVHAVLHKALRQATAWGATARNVADFVDVPQVQRQEMKALTPEQARKLLEAAKGNRFEALFVLAVMTGMRQGELLGLRWQDVDLDAGTIRVRQTAQRVKGEGLVFGPPKTEKSRRRIEVSETVVAALRRHRTKQVAERLKLGGHYEDRDLVFANECGKPLEVSNLTNRYFRPLLEKAGLPRVRFHDLRHTAATLMLAARQDVKVVSEMLGHSQTAFTMDRYQHVSESMQRQASRAVEALLGS